MGTTYPNSMCLVNPSSPETDIQSGQGGVGTESICVNRLLGDFDAFHWLRIKGQISVNAAKHTFSWQPQHSFDSLLELTKTLKARSDELLLRATPLPPCMQVALSDFREDIAVIPMHSCYFQIWPINLDCQDLSVLAPPPSCESSENSIRVTFKVLNLANVVFPKANILSIINQKA